MDPDAHAAAKGEFALLHAEFERLDREGASRQGVKANCDQTVAQLNEFLVTGISWPLRAVSIEPKLRKGETLPDAVRRVRSEIIAAQSELAGLRSAPPTPEELARDLVGQITAHARPPALLILDRKLRILWPDSQEFAAPGSTLAAPSGSASGLLCWLFHDRIVESLAPVLEQLIGRLPAGVSSEDREQRISELTARLLLLEHQEEALISSAASAGIELARRPYCSGWALLGITPGAESTETPAPPEFTEVMQAAE
jgi:hypothetical protein